MRLFLPIRPLCARARARVCAADRDYQDGNGRRVCAPPLHHGGASGKYRIAVYIVSISGTSVIVEEEIEQVCRVDCRYKGGGWFHLWKRVKSLYFFAWKFHSIRKRAVCLCVLSEGDEM